ncbi:hypothetical protein FLTE109939_03515 [Flavobacterium terrigena]|uniref:Uncharacterized protein n=1 Tax=Flavobacterium terrigena TaxID=402734 RepID=A0A1H6R3G0_9FLAO|nr:hypothetical protein SAMN05660918_0677 [Flavobacterium terrigena]
MDYLVYVLPIITILPFIISHFVFGKALKKLDANDANKYIELKKKNSKKMMIFVFFPLLFLLFRNKIENSINPIFFSIGIIILIFSLLIYFFISWNRNLKRNQFSEEFINEFKKSEYIKIGGFFFSILLFILVFNYATL